MSEHTSIAISSTHFEMLCFAEPVMTGEEFVSTTLFSRKITDTAGIERQIFQINGRNVIFRGRQEAPHLESELSVPGGSSVYPLISPKISELEQYNLGYTIDKEAVISYIDERQNDTGGNIIVATSCAAGVIASAALLTSDETRKQLLYESLEELNTPVQKSKQALRKVDLILACITMHDDNRQREFNEGIDLDGWAIALAALAGNKDAEMIAENRLRALYCHELARYTLKLTTDEDDSELGPYEMDLWNDDEDEDERTRSLNTPEWARQEPIPLEHIALVHSTGHTVAHREDGSVVLYNSAEMNGGTYPRASLHFTLNSRVWEHNQAPGAWGLTDTVIVANVQKVINTNARLPECFNGVDTWFGVNPGEPLILPDAIIISPSDDAHPLDRLFKVDKGEIIFSCKATYTFEERKRIRLMADAYGIRAPHLRTKLAELVKEIALQKAMKMVGVPSELIDVPSSDAEYMDNTVLHRRLVETGFQLGMHQGPYFYKPESLMQLNCFGLLPRYSGLVESKTWDEHLTKVNGFRNFNDAAIESRRMSLVHGYYPSRNVQLRTDDSEPKADDEYKLDFRSW